MAPSDRRRAATAALASPAHAEAGPRLRIGISSCLLGEEVRFDGGHKRDAFLTTALGPYVEWVPVCPELEAGFGVPREAMRLVRSAGAIRLLTVKTAIDLTDRLESYARRRLDELADDDLCGYVLKKDSPSCGLERVKVYGAPIPDRTGRGLFAAALAARFPSLPIEEEGRLSDARLRENFIERIFAYRRVRNLFAGRWTHGRLVAFHTAHKLTLMAHSPSAYRSLGRLVATGASAPRREVAQQYAAAFMAALATVATPGRHANVLQHMLGYFKKTLDADSRAELGALIDRYANGQLPLIVPLTLFNHHIRRHQVDYLLGQVYLNPHPAELMLRNHV
jgi:uncharacterized protein YbgA (DUF1722 family)/uncharacterized protein YbbK (DUF523 family)